MHHVKQINKIMEKNYYWRIDFIDTECEKDGFSMSVKSDIDYLNDQIVDIALLAGVIDKEDVENYRVEVEDITDDDYEMGHWESMAYDLDVE